jgi:hypothetical protein
MAFFVADFTVFSPWRACMSMRGESDLNRLVTALFLSWLLHAMLLFASFVFADRPVPALASEEVASILFARLGPLGHDENASPRPGSVGSKQAQAKPAQAEKETFLTSDKLTKRPRPIGEVNLEIPEAALLKRSGHLVLKLWIDNLGKVVSIEIDQTDLPEKFTRAVAATFGKARFEPGELYGRPVGSIMKIEITHHDDGLTPP